ncbi:MAG: hypothetical protein IKP88_13600 [Lachnospiraceae bacterium]|nr:hypothetical protein [Lachnospiraceae bacterium]
MKKKIIAVFSLVLVLVLGLGSISVSAASYKTSIKKLINHLGNVEWEAIQRMDGDYDEVVYSSSDRWKAEVAAISIPFADADLVDYIDEGYMTTSFYSIDQKAYDKECMDIFGKKISLGNLSFGYNDSYMMQASETNDYGFVVKSDEYDTETSMKDVSFSVKKSGKNYIATKKIFYGYWGEAENATEANYQVTYTFKKSSKSSFGFVLTKLTVKRL